MLAGMRMCMCLSIFLLIRSAICEAPPSIQHPLIDQVYEDVDRCLGHDNPSPVVQEPLSESGRNTTMYDEQEQSSATMTLVDDWSGPDFFDGWDFFSNPDPTHGLVNYLTADNAFKAGLAYVQKDGKAVMRVDATTDLPYGKKRNSVRISTSNRYNGGLFVLDVANAPFGLGVWPAWWTVGDNWPNNGEIDIFEGVHLGPVNQYTIHSAPGCRIDTSANSTVDWPPSTSSSVGLIDCAGPNNNGCYFKDKDTGSYGAPLNQRGGAVFAMLWTSDGVKIWHFPRGAVPADLTRSRPDPSSWPRRYLKAYWSKKGCNPDKYLRQHKIVFDITLCGDWAGPTYPGGGDCKRQVMEGSNFVDAIWKINSVKVFQ